MHLIDHLVRHRIGRNLACNLARALDNARDVIDDALAREVNDLTVACAVVPDRVPEEWAS